MVHGELDLHQAGSRSGVSQAMRYHRLLLAGVITFVTLAQSANASVDYFPYSTSWPVFKSYKKVIPGGKYVFVMIRPISAEEDETRGEDEASSQEILRPSSHLHAKRSLSRRRLDDAALDY